jgi:hypothetical protein
MVAHLVAEIRNAMLDKAFKPPTGDLWTPQMLMPGYKVTSEPTQDWDWRTQKERMKLIGKRPEPAKIKADLEARRETQTRFQMAEAAKERGATAEEIRLIMEA